MKHAAALSLAVVLTAAPAYAQLGGLRKRLEQAEQAKARVDKILISDQEERQIGEDISNRLVDRFGVFQDAGVTKYVTLVGSVLAQSSSRPALNWQFIVLDTDGVNAYAAPGGLIHITRGALGLMKNEAELAGVLGHEIAHVTEKHTIKAIREGNVKELGTEHAGSSGLTQAGIALLGEVGYDVLYRNGFDRKQEMASDQVGVRLANKVGYAPAGMIGFLNKVTERNKDMKEPNGVFASHPQMKDRIAAMEKTIRDDKLTATATVASRYAATIKFDAVPASAVAMDVPGVRAAVGEPSAKTEPPKEEKKPQSKGGLLSKLTGGSQGQNSQTVASAGSRGGVPDRDAKGGPNKSRLKISITPADIEAFKKGIAG